MKISCQSCHSKYNVADEKVQGKIVKIRCRKCGATIVVNGNAGAPANGSFAAPAPAVSPSVGDASQGASDEWHVSLGDNDQRTMTLADLLHAYNTGVVTAETFIWTEGMQDWKALSEVDAVVSALHAAASAPPPAPARAATPAPSGYGGEASAAAAFSPAAAAPRHAQERPTAAAFGGGFVAQATAAPVVAPEPKRAAVMRREDRARDLFATRTGEELQPSGSDDDARLTGQRNENSVLFSLQHLTKSAEAPPKQRPSSFENDDSGVIDLQALAARAESMRPAPPPDPNLVPTLGFVSPLAAPLGTAGSVRPHASTRSKLPLLIGGGVGITLLLVLGIGIGLKMGGALGPGAGAAVAPPVFPYPSVTPSATEVPTSSASAAASAAASASAVASTPKPHGYGFAPQHGPAPGPKPAGGGAAAAGGAATGGAATGGGAGATPAPAAPKKNDCGCNGDLMCMMKCSTH